MKTPIHTLKPGDTFANGTRRIRDNDGESIGIVRFAGTPDQWFTRIHKHQDNWNKIVEKDE